LNCFQPDFSEVRVRGAANFVAILLASKWHLINRDGPSNRQPAFLVSGLAPKVSGVTLHPITRKGTVSAARYPATPAH
jgi:hypothetical protein